MLSWMPPENAASSSGCLFSRLAKRQMVPRVVRCTALRWPLPPRELNGEKMQVKEEGGFQSISADVLRMTTDPLAPTARCACPPRVALLLSPGPRLQLPLIASSSTCADAYAPRWQVFGETNMKMCAMYEVVVGRMDAVMEQGSTWSNTGMRERAPSLRHAHPTTHTSPSPSTSSRRRKQASVASFAVESVPYALVWLCAASDCVLVSLPCEERILMLRATERTTTQRTSSSSSSTTSTKVKDDNDGHKPAVFYNGLELVSVLQLSEGVVPLDVVEVPNLPIISVGTYEHGILLCNIITESGEVMSVLRAISVMGSGSAIFPITKMAVVSAAHNNSNNRGGRSSTHTTTNVLDVADALHQVAILCCSPLESQSMLIKLTTTDAVVEPTTSPFGDAFLCARGPPSLPDGSTLIATTTSRQLLRLTASSADVRTSSRSQHDSLLVEGSMPLLRMTKMLRGNEAWLAALADGAPVRQGYTYSTARGEASYEKHWLLAVDCTNQVLLYDRTLSLYAPHSQIHLPTEERSPADAAASAATTNNRTKKEATKNNNKRVRDDSSRRDAGASVKKEEKDDDDDDDDGGVEVGLMSVIEAEALHDIAVGISVQEVRDGFISALVVHHRHLVSFITWS